MIDTLAYARKLTRAGFPREQAEGAAEALQAALTTDPHRFAITATTADLDVMLRGEVGALRTEMRVWLSVNTVLLLILSGIVAIHMRV